MVIIILSVDWALLLTHSVSLSLFSPCLSGGNPPHPHPASHPPLSTPLLCLFIPSLPLSIITSSTRPSMLQHRSIAYQEAGVSSGLRVELSKFSSLEHDPDYCTTGVPSD